MKEADGFPYDRRSGIKFGPTDEKLVGYHLRQKIWQPDEYKWNKLIPSINLYSFEPDKLREMGVDAGRGVLYFFSSRDRKYPHGKRPRRSAGNGYWKATSCPVIICDNEGQQIGAKTVLVYYIGKSPESTKTRWRMHEYKLFDTQNLPTSSCADPMRLDDCVLCKVWEKTSKEKSAIKIGNNEPTNGTTVEQVSGHP